MAYLANEVSKKLRLTIATLRYYEKEGLLPKIKRNNIGNRIYTGSYIPTPYDAVYSATKSYVLSFSNALYYELKGTGVSVTTLCPGSTPTNFAKNANIENTLLFKIFVMEADKVAEIGYRAMIKGKRVVNNVFNFRSYASRSFF